MRLFILINLAIYVWVEMMRMGLAHIGGRYAWQ